MELRFAYREMSNVCVYLLVLVDTNYTGMGEYFLSCKTNINTTLMLSGFKFEPISP